MSGPLPPPPPPGLDRKLSNNAVIPPQLVHKMSQLNVGAGERDVLDALEMPPPPPGPPPGLTGDGDAGSSRNGTVKPPPPPGFVSPVEAVHAQAHEELKKFMAWKNPSFPEEHVNLVLKMYKIEDLADAIREKYGIVPQGWRALLESDIIQRQLPKGLSRGSSLRCVVHGKKQGFLIYHLTRRRPLEHKKHLHRPGELEAKLKAEPISISDYKINEILDSELRFVSQITELQDKYLDRLYQIWDGSKANKDASKALGFTQEEANQIFEQLGSIVRFSQNLLSRLELISLVRKQPITGEGRAIHVGRAFIAMAPKLHVYAPAILSYQGSLSILNDAVSRLPKKSGGQYMNFMECWERVTASNDILRGQQLQAVLITPMQRVPRYKLLLEQLLKDCDHPDAVPVIKEALDLFSSAATNINEALRKHEKLLAFFGDGDLKPLSSSGSVVDGVVKITNNCAFFGRLYLSFFWHPYKTDKLKKNAVSDQAKNM